MGKLINKILGALSSKRSTVILSFLGVYLLSSGASWAIFSYVRGEPSLYVSEEDKRAGIDPNLPKTEECPINGKLFSEPERDIWESRRPVAVIIENHSDSRPPSGISRADVVYEAVAEGGITRFLSIFYCGAAASDVEVAPVRSARVYYIDWAAEYGDQPIFMHVGGANDYSGYGDTTRKARALELLETIGWRYAGGNDLDTTYDSGFPVFWRNYERLERTVATEHTMMASLDAAYKEAKKRGFEAKDSDGEAWDENFVEWKFGDDSASGAADATEISFEFWEDTLGSQDYAVVWKYDAGGNRYLRENGGEKYSDLVSGEQISAKNVVIQFTKQLGPVDRNKHILYTTIGKGSALIFKNGTVTSGTWEKASQEGRTRFFDENGSEVSFVRGPIWIEVLAVGNEVEY